MTNHAKLSASKSLRWLNCPGSIKAQEPYPDTTNIHAERGIKAHKLAELLLTNESSVDIGNYDQQMLRNVAKYVDYVKVLAENCRYQSVEEMVDYSEYAWGLEAYGTADAIIVDNDRVLHVVDLKYGRVKVSAVNNTQLQLYALGFMSVRPGGYFTDVKLHIFQPRIADGISVHEMTREQLLKFGDHVRDRTQLILSDNPKRIAGPGQCDWCRARDNCTEYYDMCKTKRWLM